MPTRFEIPSHKVVSEIIDGEAIVINLDTGAYYSLRDAGGEIWSLLQKKLTPREIVESIARRYDRAVSDIQGAVENLLAELEREGLVAAIEAAGEDSTNRVEPATESGAPAERVVFKPPVLQKFTDMQEFLLVDPIHEVDESGWPNKKK
jgi:hypothetical protein